jgi:metallo-beta-lactamase family protein
MKISFHGADQKVTGSCHMVECAGKRILVDCGLYQGRRELAEENAEAFGFAPESIDFLLLTHAHLDHCGRIPLLVKRGFTGEVITTAASVELARLIMLDSAGLQEEEARYQLRKSKRRGRKHSKDIEPLYTTLDALNSLEFFGRRAQYAKSLSIAPGIAATFIDAGHILGSASIFLELEENEKHHRLLFSGDLGYSRRAILRDPTKPPKVDTVVMETTYGDRLHKQLLPSIDELYEVINTTIGRGGNVIIPTFALERAQEILYYLREGVQNKRIEHFTHVFLDSPMAISAFHA